MNRAASGVANYGYSIYRDCEIELDALLEERPNFSCSWDVSIRGGARCQGCKKEARRSGNVPHFRAHPRTSPH